MKKLLRDKAKGLKAPLETFSKKISETGSCDPEILGKMVLDEMKRHDFDTVTCDRAGNIIGRINGYEKKEALVVISHLDIPSWEERKKEEPASGSMLRFKAGIISGIYAAALLRRSLLPLSGDLIVCCVPRLECCDFGIKCLFENYMKTEVGKVKGVVLCEPTDFNVYLGHKGRMEYEITVTGKSVGGFTENRGVSMLGAMFPLISELEKAAKLMPMNAYLGHSNLRIKDVRYSGHGKEDGPGEFRVVVDRVFIPEESQSDILSRARSIAAEVYRGEPDVTVSTSLSRETVKTHTGMEIVSEKEFKPWTMESFRPFAVDSLASLVENGFKSSFGYWKRITTEGSYTCAELGIPTIGFGAGSEDGLDSGTGHHAGTANLEEALYGLGLIIHRNIGMPGFGWSSDEI